MKMATFLFSSFRSLRPCWASVRQFSQILSSGWQIRAITLDKHGKSCFRSFVIDMPAHKAAADTIGTLSELVPVTGLILRETPGDYNFTWHTAPRRQFIVNLDAAVEVTVESGECVLISPGEIFFVEDVAGRGHCSRAVQGRPRRSLFLPVLSAFSPAYQ
eukprot:m.109891 g.109891  ORF g.109891 m.109891 type:complete len:160 (-) comp14321_c0_seq1:41-520(-)